MLLMRCCASTFAGSKLTVARSVAILTFADSTPSVRVRARSTLRTQLAHVMPVMGNVISCAAMLQPSGLFSQCDNQTFYRIYFGSLRINNRLRQFQKWLMFCHRQHPLGHMY